MYIELEDSEEASRALGIAAGKKETASAFVDAIAGELPHHERVIMAIRILLQNCELRKELKSDITESSDAIALVIFDTRDIRYLLIDGLDGTLNNRAEHLQQMVREITLHCFNGQNSATKLAIWLEALRTVCNYDYYFMVVVPTCLLEMCDKTPSSELDSIMRTGVENILVELICYDALRYSSDPRELNRKLEELCKAGYSGRFSNAFDREFHEVLSIDQDKLRKRIYAINCRIADSIILMHQSIWANLIVDKLSYAVFRGLQLAERVECVNAFAAAQAEKEADGRGFFAHC